MTANCAVETLAARADWSDPGLVRQGLRLFDELPRTAPNVALLVHVSSSSVREC